MNWHIQILILFKNEIRAVEQKYNFRLYDGEKQILTNQLNVKITPGISFQ